MRQAEHSTPIPTPSPHVPGGGRRSPWVRISEEQRARWARFPGAPRAPLGDEGSGAFPPPLASIGPEESGTAHGRARQTALVYFTSSRCAGKARKPEARTSHWPRDLPTVVTHVRASVSPFQETRVIASAWLGSHACGLPEPTICNSFGVSEPLTNGVGPAGSLFPLWCRCGQTCASGDQLILDCQNSPGLSIERPTPWDTPRSPGETGPSGTLSVPPVAS